MTLSTDLSWDINGIPLQTYAYNVSTWGGDLQAPPPLRGSDIVIPYRPGEVFQKRRPTGRSLTFDMWVVGADENGDIPATLSMRAQFEKNLKMLRSLFWSQGRQVTITKRWRDPGSSTVRVATAKGVYAGGFVPSMQGALRATFSVEMYLSDPFFYGPEETITFPATATSSVTPTILGDYETTDIQITLNGARNNMRVTNNSRAIYVNVNQNISTGQTILLNVDKWTATKNPGVSEANVIGAVASFGHEFWMALDPGSQQLTLSSSTGTAGATLKYKPRWV